MSFLEKVWRIPALALVVALPFVAACADDEGAGPPGQAPPPLSGTISGSVTSAAGGAIVGALVGTSPATNTALTDASGNYAIQLVPIAESGSSYAVTASKADFESASTSVSLTRTSPSATANLTLVPVQGPIVPSTGDLNVLVTDRNGVPVPGAVVIVSGPGTPDIEGVTDDNGFLLVDNLPAGGYTVAAFADFSGIEFSGAAGAGVEAGGTSFVQVVLTRDFNQSVFPNIDGEPVTLDGDATIEFISTPVGDSNPTIDCNIIRTQHMFIVEVTDGDGDAVSGVKVEWDLNLSENGTITIDCADPENPALGDLGLFGPGGGNCALPTVPGNTGSIVDSDDPDLNPATARSGLSPAFNVDSRKAVTFTNDDDQTVSFGGTDNVTVEAGQSWIIITSPVEGITDVVAHTPDIPNVDPDCGLSFGASPCDKDFAIKRWVNWATTVWQVDWLDTGAAIPVEDPFDAGAEDNPLPIGPADIQADLFNQISDGETVTNVLSRAEDTCTADVQAGIGGVQCTLSDNLDQFMGVMWRLRNDSPFNISRGFMVWEVIDDSPNITFVGGLDPDDCGAAAGGAGNGITTTVLGVFPFNLTSHTAECDGGADTDFFQEVVFTPGIEGNLAVQAFDANNTLFAGGSLPLRPGQVEDDFIGWGMVYMTLDPEDYYCDDVNADTVCDPGNAGSIDQFSPAYQALLDERVDNTNTISFEIIDAFGELCGSVEFEKEWVTSRLQIIKSTPDATIRTVDEDDGGPEVEPLDIARPIKTHTVQVDQEFRYTVTVINDGEVKAPNVRITDTLPRFGVQFDNDIIVGLFPTGQGSQAFSYVTDRPAFDPVAIVYAVDVDDDDDGDVNDDCLRGDNGSIVGNAYVVPATCAGETDAGTIPAARALAETASAGGDQIVWIQWFDDEILGRQDIGGGIQSEDSVEVTLSPDSSLIGYNDATVDAGGDRIPFDTAIPGTWCNFATVTDGPGNLDGSSTESLDADTLCHEVLEALLDVRKTTIDAVISAGAAARWDVEIANNGSAPLTNVVIHDTLDTLLGVDFFEIEIDEDWEDTVTVDIQDGFPKIFSVTIGTLPPTSFDRIYTVAASTPGAAGTFCNRITARGSNPGGTLVETDIACVTTTVTIEFDISNEDGFIDAGGAFQSSKEIFQVGEDVIYQVIITNQSAFTATNVEVVDEVAPNTSAIDFDAALTGFPTMGAISGASAAGFFWDIGDLNGGESAEIQFSATAEAAQNAVGNRVRLSSDALTGEIVDEEPTTVTE